jgi:hypothetical protein
MPLEMEKIMGLVFNLISWSSMCYGNENRKNLKDDEI